MKRRILLVILICVSLALSILLRFCIDVNQRKAVEISRLQKMKEENRSEFDTFVTNRRAFYQYMSPTANDERQRMRNLHDQLQNASDRKQLTETMERYVSWLNTIEAPTQMRELQNYSDEKRIDVIQEMLQKQRTQQGEEEAFFSEGLRERIKNELPDELKNTDPMPVYQAFDRWVTEKCQKFRESLRPEQQPMYQRWQDLFSLVFGQHIEGTSSQPGLLEKIALLSLERKLGTASTESPGVGPMSGPMPGPGFRPQSSVFIVRNQFFPELEQLIEAKKANFLDEIKDESAKNFLVNADRPIRQESLANLLILGILNHYPKINLFRLDPYQIDRQLRRDHSNQLTANYADFLSALEAERRNQILNLTPDVSMRVLSQEFFGGVTLMRDLMFLRMVGGRFRGGPDRGGPDRGGNLERGPFSPQRDVPGRDNPPRPDAPPPTNAVVP